MLKHPASRPGPAHLTRGTGWKSSYHMPTRAERIGRAAQRRNHPACARRARRQCALGDRAAKSTRAGRATAGPAVMARADRRPKWPAVVHEGPRRPAGGKRGRPHAESVASHALDLARRAAAIASTSPAGRPNERSITRGQHRGRDRTRGDPVAAPRGRARPACERGRRPEGARCANARGPRTRRHAARPGRAPGSGG